MLIEKGHNNFRELIESSKTLKILLSIFVSATLRGKFENHTENVKTHFDSSMISIIYRKKKFHIL